MDGIDIKQLNIKHLRKIVGNVEQFPVIFSGTIIDNIALGDRSISQERIESACRIANAHDFIKKLENVRIFI
jgi:ABC-type multidrug transport system fused ATPase/permease subunit